MNSVATSLHPTSLTESYFQIRQRSLFLCENLETEDFVVQPAPEVSPIKWHLAHTSWFFEQFILKKSVRNYRDLSHEYSELFNSYYKSVGPHWMQSERGHLSRPTVKEVLLYRHHVDAMMNDILAGEITDEMKFLVQVGLEHEKQHQELVLMDMKYVLSRNRIPPAAFEKSLPQAKNSTPAFIAYPGKIYEIGIQGDAFHFDNEGPCHKILLNPFSISSTLVTNREYAEFIADGGYRDPRLWLSKGWDWVQTHKVGAPFYWRPIQRGNLQLNEVPLSDRLSSWKEYTLHGLKPIDPEAPVCHISYYEADAFARWRSCRLPLESELEIFLRSEGGDSLHDQSTGFSTGYFHPTDPTACSGQLWMWTQSAYSSYPGYKPFSGTLGEYNGKFMCNQFVLRGGCVATPPQHFRSSYRNFYEPQQRWMFSGIRLAKDSQ